MVPTLDGDVQWTVHEASQSRVLFSVACACGQPWQRNCCWRSSWVCSLDLGLCSALVAYGHGPPSRMELGPEARPHRHIGYRLPRRDMVSLEQGWSPWL